jgi:hypothetical protein
MNWAIVSLPINAVTFGSFAVLARKRRPGAAALIVGGFHLLLSAVFSVAPWRSMFDAHYPGFRVGLLHFDGRSAVIPASLFFGWSLFSALACACGATSRRILIVAAGDVLFAMNMLVATFGAPGDNEIQFGQYLSIRGFAAAALMALLFSGGPLASSVWAVRRRRRAA